MKNALDEFNSHEDELYNYGFTTMNDDLSYISSGFDRFKQKLDPDFNYLFCEKECRSKGQAVFEDVISILDRLGIGILDHYSHFDESAGRCLLVVKFDSPSADSVLSRLLDSRLPRDLLFSLYSSCSSHKGQNP